MLCPFSQNNGYNLVFNKVRARNHICEANETPVVVYRVDILFRDYYSVLITLGYRSLSKIIYCRPTEFLIRAQVKKTFIY